MSASSKKASHLKAIDPIWDSLLGDARMVLVAEPSLSNLLISSVLNHESFEEALAHRLAERLHHADVSADIIRQAFMEAIGQRPAIGEEARADLAATYERDPACHKPLDAFLYFKGYQAIQTHRFVHQLWTSGRRDFALYLQSRSSQVFQVDINPAARIGRGIMLDHATGFVVGETAVIGNNVSILQDVTLGGTGKEDEDRHPKIADGVLIGAGAIVLGNIKVGENARIGAGSVVTKEVPCNVTVAGVPAKIIGGACCEHPSVTMDHVNGVPDTSG